MSNARSAAPEIRTPDGRYIVVRRRLWRATNPHLPAAEKNRLVASLMTARRQLRKGLPAEDCSAARAAARVAVDAAKVALGERGPVWWTDNTPDFNRCMACNTPYAEWFATLEGKT